jgi:predicted dehydrogenase
VNIGKADRNEQRKEQMMSGTDRASGMNYAPAGKPAPVCGRGDFVFAATALDHGHIYGMCNGLTEAGGTLKYVYDADRAKAERFAAAYEGVKIVESEQDILQDNEISLVAGAAVASKRCDLGIRVMRHGKDYFTDKAPLTTLDQLQRAKQAVAETGKKYMVYYSERLHVEGAVYAGQLIADGAIGRVLQVIGLGPHRLGVRQGWGRPDWFWQREHYGGILCDIGSHQIEQYLSFAGEGDATVVKSQIANYANPDHPELDDFGDALLVGNNGSTNYFRVDWFTPDGLPTWGDGRTMILGTNGYIEIRKYIDIGRDSGTDHVYLVNDTGEHHMHVEGKVGFPYFGALILDCINRTEHAMTQEHAFKAAELSVIAQRDAVKLI